MSTWPVARAQDLPPAFTREIERIDSRTRAFSVKGAQLELAGTAELGLGNPCNTPSLPPTGCRACFACARTNPPTHAWAVAVAEHLLSLWRQPVLPEVCTKFNRHAFHGLWPMLAAQKKDKEQHLRCTCTKRILLNYGPHEISENCAIQVKVL